jgi:hypothetical protein
MSRKNENRCRRFANDAGRNRMKSFLCYTITFLSVITILAIRFAASAQARSFWRRSGACSDLPEYGKMLKDCAYQAPIVGLLADCPSRV